MAFRWRRLAGTLLLLLALFFVLSLPLQAQEPVSGGQQVKSQTEHEASHVSSPTPLARLVEEAESKNPQILGAGHAWKASSQVPSQASTLPDPQVTVQRVFALSFLHQPG